MNPPIPSQAPEPATPARRIRGATLHSAASCVLRAGLSAWAFRKKFREETIGGFEHSDAKSYEYARRCHHRCTYRRRHRAEYPALRRNGGVEPRWETNETRKACVSQCPNSPLKPTPNRHIPASPEKCSCNTITYGESPALMMRRALRAACHHPLDSFPLAV